MDHQILKYLSAFLKVAELKSFSKAANELKIATSAVSRQIKLLEEVSQIKLLNRNQKAVELTIAGEDFFELSKNFITNLNDTINKHHINNNVHRPRVLRIGALQSVFEEKLLPILKDKKNPKFNVRISTPKNLIKLLTEKEIDIALTSLDQKTISGLDVIKIYNERPCLTISKNKNLDTNKDNLIKIIFGPYEEYWNKIHGVNKYISSENNISNETIEVNSLTAAVELVKSKIGISILPETIAKKNNLDFIKLKDLNFSDIYFCTRKLDMHDNLFKKFFKTIRQNTPNNIQTHYHRGELNE